jgi:A/G-specific adenine glycosylase
VKQLRRRLLQWYRRNRRDLPWRQTDDPYAIWISETMLQQTRVDTAIPYYERFLTRFPTASALAEAPSEDVMEHWAGLGYYRRARNLQAAARIVVAEHGGRVPDDVDTLLSLPGVGRYTAGAVASIAFDRPAPIVDGNVARVLARVLDLHEDVRGTAAQRTLWETAEALARGPSPGDLNQGLMELGALVCTPKEPACDTCPIAADCRAHAAGHAESLPIKSPARKPTHFEASCAWLVRRGRVLVVRRPPDALLGGLFELPGGDLEPREAPEQGLARQLRERIGLEPKEIRPLGELKHVFSHRVLRLHVHTAELPEGRVRRRYFDRHRWVGGNALEGLALSALARKAIALAAPTPPTGA